MNKLLAVALLLLINISNGFSESTPRPEYPRPSIRTVGMDKLERNLDFSIRLW